MIHGGLTLDFKSNLPVNQAYTNHCCLRQHKWTTNTTQPFWHNSKLQPLRDLNKKNLWDSGCANCQRLEATDNLSFRQGMNQGLGIYSMTDLPGPARIDLMFDISCNLACRICSPESSTLWQKHLKDHGLWNAPISAPRRKQEVIEALQNLDLSNLKQLVFCGGETLLGQEYWDVAAWLAGRVGEVFDTRVTGVQKFGLFATIIGLGGDGLVPISTLGAERFAHDEKRQVLVGEETGEEFAMGMILKLRLAEANPLTGALKFEPVELPEGAGRIEPRGGRPFDKGPRKAGGYIQGPRGRPRNIRHQGRKK
jgi:hypothetical protein